jgi:hypothetical protein
VSAPQQQQTPKKVCLCGASCSMPLPMLCLLLDWLVVMLACISSMHVSMCQRKCITCCLLHFAAGIRCCLVTLDQCCFLVPAVQSCTLAVFLAQLGQGAYVPALTAVPGCRQHNLWQPAASERACTGLVSLLACLLACLGMCCLTSICCFSRSGLGVLSQQRGRRVVL